MKAKTLSQSLQCVLTLSLAIASVFGLASCTSDEFTTPATATEMHLYVNGDLYNIALPATEAVNLVTLGTEFDTEFRVDNAAAFQGITISGHTLTGGKCAFRVSEISKEAKITISYTTGGKTANVILNTLHSGIPEIRASGQAVIPGQFYLSFIYQRLIMKYDNDGKVIYYRYEPTHLAGTFSELGYWDFKKHEYEGKTYYSYHAPDPKYADLAFTGYDPGMRVLMDDHYVPIDTIHALASLDGYLPENSPLDGHDFWFFSPTHYIVSASYIEREVNGEPRAVAYLQEVDNGEVVFDWWSTSHPDMADWCSPIFDTSYDYVHFNSIQVLPDGNWFCSFRLLNSLLKIDRAGGTGAILWRINGDEQDEPQKFYGQHYATLYDDGILTVFDNGNGHDPQITRILRLQINPDTGEVLGGGDMLNPGGDYFTHACGAVQLFGERFTVGWGWGVEMGKNDRLVTEHDATGREIFSLRFPRLRYRQNSSNSTYRCVKYE